VVAENRLTNPNVVAVWQEFLNISVSGESVKSAAEDDNVKSAERRSYILAEYKYHYSRSPGIHATLSLKVS
jgi:hypothetical protein